MPTKSDEVLQDILFAIRELKDEHFKKSSHQGSSCFHEHSKELHEELLAMKEEIATLKTELCSLKMSTQKCVKHPSNRSMDTRR